jgi:type II secretory ATPase GspE/PulE/Tfp pilus assembly ATPase PilB-like protein
VLSTLHTNSAVGAIARLKDMGVEPFLINSSMLGVLAQRLVRRICVKCREELPVAEHYRQMVDTFKLQGPFYRGAGFASTVAAPATRAAWACTSCSRFTEEARRIAADHLRRERAQARRARGAG